MKKSRVLFGLLALSMTMVMPAVAADYDLVINNGRVMDPETMYDAVANVGVKDGRIAVITKKEITGKESIDATGHVVAPGFIDTHWHYDRPGPTNSLYVMVVLRFWILRSEPTARISTSGTNHGRGQTR
jgi:adenine deaminase